MLERGIYKGCRSCEVFPQTRKSKRWECGRSTSLGTRFGATTKFRNHHQSAKVGSIESDNIIVRELFLGLIIIERRPNALISSVPLPVARSPCEFHLFYLFFSFPFCLVGFVEFDLLECGAGISGCGCFREVQTASSMWSFLAINT